MAPMSSTVGILGTEASGALLLPGWPRTQDMGWTAEGSLLLSQPSGVWSPGCWGGLGASPAWIPG